VIVSLTNNQVALLKQLMEAKAAAESNVNLMIQALAGDLEKWESIELNVSEKTLTYVEPKDAVQE